MELISSIIGRGQIAVSSILGPPDRIEILAKHKYPLSVRAIYLEGEIEIIFIDQVADWITITNEGISTSLDFIDFIGLIDIEPKLTVWQGTTLISSMTYTEVEGIKEITIHLSSSIDIDTISIKAFNL